MKKSIAAALALVASVATLSGQEFTYHFEFSTQAGTPVENKVVKDAPYSAQYVSEHVQTLADGNRIVRSTTGRIYRDKDGRVRREQDRPSGSPLVTITDPVANTSVTLDIDKRTARSTSTALFVDLKQRVEGMKLMVTETRSASGTTTRALAPSQTGGGGRGGGGGGRARAGGPIGERTEEELAPQTLHGVAAKGIRRTTTIAQGAVGNERPIQIVSEEWTSTDLQVLVLTDLNDPRSGRSTYRLTNITRGNQAASLFEIPAGYTIVKQPSPDWIIKNDR